MTWNEARKIIVAMLDRDNDLNSPDFEMFTVPQRRALMTIINYNLPQKITSMARFIDPGE